MQRCISPPAVEEEDILPSVIRFSLLLVNWQKERDQTRGQSPVLSIVVPVIRGSLVWRHVMGHLNSLERFGQIWRHAGASSPLLRCAGAQAACPRRPNLEEVVEQRLPTPPGAA